MSSRLQFVQAAVESFLSGAVAGLAVNGAWWLATGSTPSMVTTLIAAEVVTGLWGAGQALHFRRQWQQVLTSYNLPALGQGIDIPHRPPADEPPYYGHVVDYDDATGSAPECVDDCPGCESEAGEPR
jgi:hypothetical protein